MILPPSLYITQKIHAIQLLRNGHWHLEQGHELHWHIGQDICVIVTLQASNSTFDFHLVNLPYAYLITHFVVCIIVFQTALENLQFPAGQLTLERFHVLLSGNIMFMRISWFY